MTSLEAPADLAAIFANLTPEQLRKFDAFITEHPEWADLAHVARLRRFRDAAAQLILACDDAGWNEAQTRRQSVEQGTALFICDRLADIFDFTLGGPQGAHRDELFRMASAFSGVSERDNNVEERRARGVLLIED